MTKEERDALERYDDKVYADLQDKGWLILLLFITPILIKFLDWDSISGFFLFLYYIAFFFGGGTLLFIRFAIHELSITTAIEKYDRLHSGDNQKYPSRDFPSYEVLSPLISDSLRKKIVAHGIKKGHEEKNKPVDELIVLLAQTTSKTLIEKYPTIRGLDDAREAMVKLIDEAIDEKLRKRETFFAMPI